MIATVFRSRPSRLRPSPRPSHALTYATAPAANPSSNPFIILPPLSLHINAPLPRHHPSAHSPHRTTARSRSSRPPPATASRSSPATPRPRASRPPRPTSATPSAARAARSPAPSPRPSARTPDASTSARSSRPARRPSSRPSRRARPSASAPSVETRPKALVFLVMMNGGMLFTEHGLMREDGLRGCTAREDGQFARGVGPSGAGWRGIASEANGAAQAQREGSVQCSRASGHCDTVLLWRVSFL